MNQMRGWWFRTGLVSTGFGAVVSLIQILTGSVRFTTTGMEGATVLFMMMFTLIGIGFCLMAVFYNYRNEVVEC